MKEILLEIEIEANADGDYSVISPRGLQLRVRVHVASEACVKMMWIDGAVIAQNDPAAGQLFRGELQNALATVWDTVDHDRKILGAWFG